MDIREAESLARELMAKHLPPTWRFAFDNAKRRLGRCSYRKNLISLSREYTTMNDVSLIRDTILHEIAHALTPGADHGRVWQLMAVAIGARPKTCKDAREVKFAPTDWSVSCSDCGATIPKYRRPKFDGRRHWHTPCAYKPNRGTILWFFRGQQHDDNGNPVALVLAQAAEVVKPVTETTRPNQDQINELWERLNRLEGRQ